MNQALEKARAKAVEEYNNARKTYTEARDAFLKALDAYKKDYEELFKELEITNVAQQGRWACCEEEIDEATAQPEQEPVAWMVYTQEGQSAFVTDNPAQIHPSQRALPLYATPQRPWVGLTHQETKDCMAKWDGIDVYVLCRAIEAKLREKNL